MTTERLMVGGVFEVIALIVVVRIWLKRRHKKVMVRLLWSLVLLVPFFGLIAYFFPTENPDGHPYEYGRSSDSDDSPDPGSAHH